jgi:hypothetical protein
MKIPIYKDYIIELDHECKILDKEYNIISEIKLDDKVKISSYAFIKKINTIKKKNRF